MENSLQFDSLHEGIVNALGELSQLGKAMQRNAETSFADRGALWKELADLRDELHTQVHALSNRIEAVYRSIPDGPGDVAARIVTDANRGLRDATR